MAELNDFTKKDEVFKKLKLVKCKTEKKGRFTYISWTDAWEKVKEIYPNANFEVHTTENGFPAFINSTGGFVKVSVTIEGLTHSEFYPVINNFNKSIQKDMITTMDINTSIKRCMVKCLAYFGLGLYVYQGEDLPNEDDNNTKTTTKNTTFAKKS